MSMNPFRSLETLLDGVETTPTRHMTTAMNWMVGLRVHFSLNLTYKCRDSSTHGDSGSGDVEKMEIEEGTLLLDPCCNVTGLSSLTFDIISFVVRLPPCCFNARQP